MKPPTSGWHSSSRSSAVSSCPGMSIISGPSSVLAVVDLLFVELNVGTCGNKIKQLDDIFIAHAHTAMRRRPPQCRDIRRAVKIDIATERIDATQPIAAGLGTRQPENTREYPVATRILRPQFGGPDLARPATDRKSTRLNSSH